MRPANRLVWNELLRPAIELAETREGARRHSRGSGSFTLLSPAAPRTGGNMAIIFARTRWEYASYIDFWKVVELSGFPIVYVDEIDPQSDNIYIVTPLNGEWQVGWQNPRARIILWDLEWRDSKPNVPGVAEVWASDVDYANRMEMRYVILGSHPNLCPEARRDKWEYDVCMMAYITHRRGIMEGRLKDEGLRIAPNYGAEDNRRHDVLMCSRMVLHVHQHEDIRTISPTRWQTAAAYRLPILSETVDRPSVFEYTCLWADYNNLPIVAKLAMSGQYSHELDEFSKRFHEQLCVEYPFRRCVEDAVR